MDIEIRFPVARFLGDRRVEVVTGVELVPAKAMGAAKWVELEGTQTVEVWELTPRGKAARLLIALVGSEDGAEYQRVFCGGARIERLALLRKSPLRSAEIRADDRFLHLHLRHSAAAPYEPRQIQALESVGRALAERWGAEKADDRAA